MRVEITKEDIDNGIPCNNFSCPIALALKRYYPDKVISVGKLWITIEGVYHKMRYYKNSPIVRKFINDFDDDIPVEPFSFEPFSFDLPIEEE
jgi:hypothetical protein